MAKMKTAKIIRKYLGNLEDEVLLIENEQDLAAYERFMQGVAGNLIRQALASDLPPRKLDHLLHGKPSHAVALVGVAMNAARISEVTDGGFSIWHNPFWQIMPAAALKIATLKRLLFDGPIIINKAGGFMPCTPKNIKIVEIYDASPPCETVPEDIIQRRTKYIVLENDWTLPHESAKYLQRVDPRHSTIFDLRNHSDGVLRMRLKRFKDNGGHTVFVYTTGLDVPQMYRYTESILAVGLSKIVFHFTGSTTPGIQQYLDDHRERLSITVLGNISAE